MKARALGVGFAALFFLGGPAGAQTSPGSPREIYEALNRVRVDEQAVYPVQHLELRRGDVRLAFDEGTLAFLTPCNGHITGAVFSGRGHALAAPRDPVEKQQLARFLGRPVLDEEFRTAYLRFTDETAEELQKQLRETRAAAAENREYAAQWNTIAGPMNPPHALRILADWIAEEPRPYFYAALEGLRTGAFEVVLDARREETLTMGQMHAADGANLYDVWAAYRPGGNAPPAPAFRALRYAIETAVLPDHSLEGTATIAVRAERGGERLLAFELSRNLAAESVSGAGGEELDFFQNEGLNKQERSQRGNDALYVALPRAARRGEEFALRVRYRGRVISDAGNGVLYVGERGSWYPHLGGADSFADYELTLRWPRRLRLVATGTKLEEHEEGEFRVGRWRTEKPVSVAGFNLGEYASTSLDSGAYAVEVYANRQLEEALRKRLAAPDSAPDNAPGATVRGARPFGVPPSARMELPAAAPNPADMLRQLAREISSSIHFYESYSGPFPYRQLQVSQIPGTFGQGWPGLLYISTFSFLPAEAQQRAGLSTAAQEHFTELVPFHEVAHQWWGNVVGWQSYRDQWVTEAIANYLALLFADSQKKPERTLRDWLERYRKQLLTKSEGAEAPPAEIGPLTLGSRLNSSKSPAGFDQVVYGKGTWVMHMLRMQLRQPGSRNPDARFEALLRTLATKYANRALSTGDLQREVEAVMTPAMAVEGGRSMDWFFEEWVRGVGIPHYRVKYSVKSGEDGGYVVRGKLQQTGVPRGFVTPVPLYASTGGGRSVALGTVVASGEETSFRFTTPSAPRKILIDPQMTLLCVAE
ncbi:MAG: hypothetical protein LAN61_12580 [Acidobacteriia bacterium]|nr:hypothetical protein [Terriglobia bacterium]